jgi:putative tryptophan/tyrosine transport system substrate-binding protein
VDSENSNSRVSTKPGQLQLELLHELVPKATTIAVLINPLSPLAEPQVRELQAAAQTLGLSLQILRASNERELENSFADLQQLRAGALLITADVFFSSRNAQVAALTLRYAVPTAAQFREFAVAGGLMSYGGSISDALRLVGNYAGRILKGERPADLPVQQLTRVELVLNQNAARALGIIFPITLLGRADEVIE